MANQQRVVLVTGGMGGLGESISTKMADAGYRVVVTYSPGNTKHGEWVGQMKQNGYDIMAVACDVSDFDSCARAVGRDPGQGRRGRRPRQQRRHHARHDLQEDGQGQLGRGDAHQPRQPVQHDQAGRRRHGRAQLGPDHQRVVGQRLEGRVRPDQLFGGQGRRPRLHQGAGARSRQEGRDRQHHLARLHRHQDGDGDTRGDPELEDPAADPDRPSRQARRSGRARSSTWPPTKRRS